MRRVALVLAFSATWAGAERLTLKGAEEMALRSHPRLQSTRYQADAAKEVPTEVRARLKPQAFAASTGALAEDSNTRLLAGGFNNPIILSRWGVGVGMSQLVSDFGRTKHLAESAEKRAEAAGEAVRTTRAQILLSVHRSYFEALEAQAILRVASETVKARELLVNRATALAANKLKSELDVTFASVDLQEAKLLQSNAANAARSSIVQLSAALGLNAPGEFELVEEPLPEPLPADWEGLAKEALAQRPEIKQASLDEQAAAALVKSEKALLYPSINAVASTGVAPFHNQRLQGHWNAGGITVDLPFLNGGLFAARRREAEAKEKAASATVRDVANQVGRDVRLAYLNAVNAQERLQLSAVLIQQARQSFELAKARYDLGLSSIVEVSQSQLALTRAEIAQTRAKFEYQSARAMLTYQQGAL